jgi:hypothetical protein
VSVWSAAADVLVGDVIEGQLANRSETARREVVGEIEKLCADRPLVLLVDDLDRVAPQELPRLLMMLRDGLSLPGVYQVLALDPTVVSTGLQSEHPGWGGAFIEKIVEWPFWLADLSDREVRSLVAAQIARSPASISENAVLGVAEWLPKNPRKLRAALRNLGLMSETLARFGEAELDRATAYLGQLLRTEFPQETNELLASDEKLKQLEHLLILKSMESKHSVEEVPRPPASRFDRMTEALALRMQISVMNTRQVLTLFDHPPAITRKELEDLVEQAGGVLMALRGFAAAGVVKPEGLLPAVFAKLVDLREARLNAAVDERIEELQRAALGSVARVTQALVEAIEVGRWFAEGRIGAAEWIQLFVHLAKWSAWRHPIYRQTRADEIRLLEASSIGLSPDASAECLAEYETRSRNAIWERESWAKKAKKFRSRSKEIVREFERAVCERILARFTETDGLDAWWGSPTGSPSVEKSMAFDPASRFHTDFRTKLKVLAAAARTNGAAHANMLRYCDMLLYGATHAGSFNVLDCQALAKDASLMRIVFSGAIARPLNVRTVGSLRAYIQEIVTKLGVPSSNFPENRLWKNAIAILDADG